MSWDLFHLWRFMHGIEYLAWLEQHPEIKDSPAAWIRFAKEYGK